MYRHYKGGIYYTLGITRKIEGAYYINNVKFIQAFNTETEELVKVYMSNERFNVVSQNNARHMLYIDAEGNYWLRPVEMFFGKIDVNGKMVERFS